MVGEERNMLTAIHQRQLKFIGHITKEDSIEKLSLEGIREGSRCRGRQRQDFLQSLVTIAGMETIELPRFPHDREGFKSMVAKSDSDMARKEERTRRQQLQNIDCDKKQIYVFVFTDLLTVPFSICSLEMDLN